MIHYNYEIAPSNEILKCPLLEFTLTEASVRKNPFVGDNLLVNNIILHYYLFPSPKLMLQ